VQILVHCLAVPCLVLGSVVAFGQRSSSVPSPAHPGRPAQPLERPPPAFSAPRLLTDLTEGAPNLGVDLTGDVDNDGDLDLLAFEYTLSLSPTGVQVWRNEGHGSFVHASTLPITTENLPFLSLADFTGDGVLDLVYAHIPGFIFARSSVYVHPGAGNGSFGAGLMRQTNGQLQDLVVGDCDGDGDSDLLVHDPNTLTDDMSTLAWWHLEGGSLVSSAQLVVDAEPPLWLTALDADGNGITDAASGTAGTANGADAIQVFRTVSGEPTFGAAIPLPVELHHWDLRLQTGDLDDDGGDDVLVVLETGEDVFYFQPILNGAAGFVPAPLQTFPNTYLDDSLRREGTLADWDADGDVDYISPDLTWMENTGDGNFALAGSMYGIARDNSYSPGVLVIDLDSDGHLDTIKNWSCFFGDGTFPLRNSLARFDDPDFLAWSRLEDWEGDGDLDLISSTKLYLNNGDGTFAARPTVLPSIPEATGSVSVRGWGDFDGDGFRDVVVAAFEYPVEFVGMVLCTGTENGTYLRSPTVPSSVEMTMTGTSLTGDLDGDGDLDILTGNGFWRNDGSARFGTSPIPAYTGIPACVTDLERDGDLDLLVDGGSVGTNMRLLRNLGGLSFEDTLIGSSGSEESFLDVDEDGDLDLAVTYADADLLRVFLQLPGGALGAPTELTAPGVDGPAGQVDVDGDGRLDLVVGRSFDGFGHYSPLPLLSAWIRKSGLAFAERRDWATSESPLAFGDIDRDGDVEPLGSSIFENLRFDGPSDGFAVQYGLDDATSGTGGLHPVLGSGGPARPGQRAKFVIAGSDASSMRPARRSRSCSAALQALPARAPSCSSSRCSPCSSAAPATTRSCWSTRERAPA